jgi:hypothetical protein
MTMLDTNLIDTLATPAPDDALDDASLQRITDSADRGDYLEAAGKAAALLGKHIYDIRVIGYYLFGVVLEHGIGHLPAMLGRVHTLLTDDLADLGPSQKKERVIDVTLHWLLQTMAERCRYHAAQHDATWAQWLSQLHPRLAGEIAQALDRVATEMQQLVEEPRCLGPLSRLRRWVMEDLPRTRPAESPAPAAAPGLAPARAPGEAAEIGQASAPATVARDADGSPAMQLLLRKLRAFEVLIERGDMSKAAVVASDIRQTIESFDPLAYLPALFSTFFKLLSRSTGELMPHWEELACPAGQALQSFYRVDLDGFLDS